MSRDLLVCKRLEKRGQIGGLYLPEAMLLLAGCVLLFVIVMALRSAFAVHILWLLTAPALFVLVFLLAKTCRKTAHPHLVAAYYTFHCLAPQEITITCPYVLVVQEKKKRPGQLPAHPRLGGRNNGA